jgi:hypothetical protein
MKDLPATRPRRRRSENIRAEVQGLGMIRVRDAKDAPTQSST